jgi:hypothetical protein
MSVCRDLDALKIWGSWEPSGILEGAELTIGKEHLGPCWLDIALTQKSQQSVYWYRTELDCFCEDKALEAEV